MCYFDTLYCSFPVGYNCCKFMVQTTIMPIPQQADIAGAGEIGLNNRTTR